VNLIKKIQSIKNIENNHFLNLILIKRINPTMKIINPPEHNEKNAAIPKKFNVIYVGMIDIKANMAPKVIKTAGISVGSSFSPG